MPSKASLWCAWVLVALVVPGGPGCSCDENRPTKVDPQRSDVGSEVPANDRPAEDVPLDRVAQDVADQSGPEQVGPDLAEARAEVAATVDEACAKVSDICQQLEVCNSLEFADSYGTVPDCVEAKKPRCVQMANAAGATPETVERCMLQIAAQCGQLDDASLRIPECDVRGIRGNGASCGHAWECMSGRCAGAPVFLSCADGDGDCAAQPQPQQEQACGTCQPRSPQDGVCEHSADCEIPLECLEGRCRQAGSTGENCYYRPCRPALVCRNGICSPPAEVGAACSAFSPCRRDQSLVCDPTAGICRPPPTSVVGKPCGPAGLGAVCPKGSTCAPNSAITVCVPLVPVGGGCQPPVNACPRFTSCRDGVCLADRLDRCN